MKTHQRVVGSESYINSQTGELVNMQVVETDTYEKDSDFHKLFLKAFSIIIEEAADQKMKLVFWVISHLTKDNKLLYTYRQIGEKAGVSYRAVTDTMKIFFDKDFVRRQSSGHYIINPNMIFKGSYQRRCRCYHEYSKAEPAGCMPAGDADEIKLRKIQKSIARLQKQARLLEGSQDSSELCKSDAPDICCP